jgi:hypothetical protein
MENKIEKLSEILEKANEIANNDGEHLAQIFIDYVENAQEKFYDLRGKEHYNNEFICQDFVSSLEYSISNILEIAKPELHTTFRFKELLEALKTFNHDK